MLCCGYQGDEEKAKGLTPMPMMDREKKHELPQLEVRVTCQYDTSHFEFTN